MPDQAESQPSNKREEERNSLDKPHPRWLPLHLAMFHFIEKSGVNKDDWQLALSRYISRRAVEATTSLFEDEVRAQFGRYRLAISRERGVFRLDDMNAEDPKDFFMTDLPYGYPTDFLKEAWEEGKCPADADPAIALAQAIAYFIEQSFAEAVWTGRASIFARAERISAPFSQIYPDQWRLLNIKDRGDPFESYGSILSLSGPGNTVYYSPYVASASPDAGKAEPLAAKRPLHLTQRKDECLVELVRLMKEFPDGPTIAETERWAKERWGFSGKETRRCIDEAKKQVKSKWYEGGRPRKGRPSPFLKPWF